jgi:YVTN family beta-propeller protein
VNLLFSAGQTFFTSQVSVVDTATDAIVATISVGADAGISITPDGAKLYVVDADANSVTVVDTATNATTAIIPVGNFPITAGNFIQPAQPAAPRFAGTPGNANCYGRSVSALVLQDGGLNAAAAALGFASMGALQNAILAFCGG